MANVPSLVSLKEVSSSCWLLSYLLCQYQQVMVVADSDSTELALQYSRHLFISNLRRA